MNHLVAPQEEKRESTQWAGKLPVDHEIPPQYEPPVAAAMNTLHNEFSTSKGAGFLVAPQEEKITTSRAGNGECEQCPVRAQRVADRSCSTI